MPILFIDYTNKVLEYFREKEHKEQLPQLLMDLTTNNIKQACLNEYDIRKLRGEEEGSILEFCFGVPAPGKDFRHAINRRHPDKFKPLQRLIQGKIKNPKQITVELLAWLIDFNPRPLSRAKQLLEFEPPESNVAEGEETIIMNSDPVDKTPIIASDRIALTKTSELQVVNENKRNAIEIDDLLEKAEVSVTGNYKSETGINTKEDKPVEKRRVEASTQKLIKIATLIALIGASSFSGYYLSKQLGITTGGSATAKPVVTKCKAITKSGTPCRRNADSTGYCWQHPG